jgi:hypothetical protein
MEEPHYYVFISVAFWSKETFAKEQILEKLTVPPLINKFSTRSFGPSML